MGSVCHGYIWMLLYMKLIWCSGFPEIYAQLEEEDGVSLPWVYLHSDIYLKIILCSGFPVICA